MRWINNKHIVWIIGLQIIAVMLFYFGYANLSLRLDESQSLWQTSHSVGELLNSLSRNVHVPFYHTTVHYWQIFWGNGVVAGRVYSLIFFLASIVLIYVAGKKIFNTYTGIVAATLLTLSPFMNWYASEIRMYTLVVFLTIAFHMAFIQLLRQPTRMLWVLYTLLAVVGIYSHYFFSLVIFSHIIYFASYGRKVFEQKQVRGFILSGISVALLFLPWVYKVFSAERGLGSSPLLSVPDSIDFFNVFSNFLFGFQTDTVNSIILSLWPLVFILLLLSIRKHVSLSEESKFLVIATLTPLGAAFIISIFVTPVFLSRYLIIVLPALYLILARALVVIPVHIRVPTGVALSVGMIGMLLVQLLSPLTPVKEKFNDVGAYLNTEVTGRDVVTLSAPFLIYPIDYYYDGPARIETLPRWNRYNGEELPAFEEKKLAEHVEYIRAHHERLFLVLGYDQGYEKIIQTYLDSRFPILEERVFSKDLTVRVYKVRFYDPYESFTSIVSAVESFE